MALAGLARHAPPDATHILLFDFGQTFVKRGTATYQAGKLVALAVRPALPVAGPAFGATDCAAGEAWKRWQWMADLIEADWRCCAPAGGRERVALGLSLATHMEAGHPLDAGRGLYSRLQVLAPHLATFMRDEFAVHLGSCHSLTLLHDGLAAASLYAGRPKTVVMALGTAIGAGYVPPDSGLRPLAGELTLTRLQDRTITDV
jgi:hypothetical protein